MTHDHNFQSLILKYANEFQTKFDHICLFSMPRSESLTVDSQKNVSDGVSVKHHIYLSFHKVNHFKYHDKQ